MAVRKHLVGEDAFLANYADGLSDLPLNSYIDNFLQSGKIASFVCVKPTSYFHVVTTDTDGTVQKVQELPSTPIRMNGGFFVFRSEIFSYLKPGQELVNEPFERLIQERMLVAQNYNGFWLSMDTFKDKQILEDLYATNRAPWEVWKRASEMGPGQAETKKVLDRRSASTNGVVSRESGNAT
jgi:glucose-1-phosphate cytidylyltransferase